MLSLADPWVGFWLPLGLVCLSAGFWLTDREDLRRRLCLPFFLTAAVLLVLHGAKTQGGDAVETALLAVLLDMAGPVGLMAVGTLIATASASASPLQGFSIDSLGDMGFGEVYRLYADVDAGSRIDAIFGNAAGHGLHGIIRGDFLGGNPRGHRKLPDGLRGGKIGAPDGFGLPFLCGNGRHHARLHLLGSNRLQGGTLRYAYVVNIERHLQLGSWGLRP